ncbi:divalent cation tolerance protein CutA [candidate division GN15 bacterium]|nr:divalent cation tolerance protein CutA [candidate division GN15 bacterium]
MESIRVVLVSVPRDEARELATAIVEERLAACINIVPRIDSVYWWDDKIETDSESLMIIKTTAGRIDELIEYIEENHPYDLPEVLALPLTEGLPDYIAWIKEETE